MTDYLFLALRSLVPNCQYSFINNQIYWDVEENNGIECPTEEQIQAKIVELQNAEPMRLLRLERNRKLTETDWMSFSDSPTMSTEWQTYRQALRDLPANSTPSLDENGNLTGVEWPTKPE